MRPVKKIPPPYLPELLASTADERRAVHHALRETLGNYCSYCEMPLSDYHVEHLRYFAEWPERISFSEWNDLLLICNDCRNHIRVPVLNELSASTMLWPDRDITFSIGPRSPLKYELRNVKYVVVEDGLPVSEEYKQLVFVVPNYEAGPALYQKAFNTIAHFQLNMQLEYYDERANEFRIPLPVHLERLDNRMFKRTEAWFDAESTVDRLKLFDQPHPEERSDVGALRRIFIDQVAMNAWYSGNWSVWMTVFYERTGDIDLMQQAFAGDVHVFAGLNNDNNSLFRTE